MAAESTLEQRLAELEARVPELQARLDLQHPAPEFVRLSARLAQQ